MADAITHEYARRRLKYDPETGVIYWRECGELCPAWNGRWAGNQATGSVDRDGYARIRILGRAYPAHRLAWLIHYGEWPTDQIDHINGDPADNRIANLRVVTLAENQRNKARLPKNTSGVNGVSWNKRDQRFHARIRVDGKLIHLGSFHTLEEAAAARGAANIRFGFTARHGQPRVEVTVG